MNLKEGVDPAGRKEVSYCGLDGPILIFLRLKLKGRLLIGGYWFWTYLYSERVMA